MKFYYQKFAMQSTSFTMSKDYTSLRGDKYEDYTFAFLGKRTYMGEGYIDVILPSFFMVGNYTSMGQNVTLILNQDHDYMSVTNYPFYMINQQKDYKNPLSSKNNNKNIRNTKRQIVIGHDVWIGDNVTILSGTYIGNGAVVGAGSVVSGVIPPYSVVAGVPARVIKYRFPEEICNKLNEIKWWYWDEKTILDNIDLFEDPEQFTSLFYKKNDLFKGELTGWISAKKKNNGKVFLAIADETQEYPDWKHILEEYLKIRKDNDYLLFIGKNKTINLNEYHDDKWGILYDVNYDESLQLLKGADFFIADRNEECNYLVDYAYTYGLKIVHGLNSKPFMDIHL